MRNEYSARWADEIIVISKARSMAMPSNYYNTRVGGGSIFSDTSFLADMIESEAVRTMAGLINYEFHQLNFLALIQGVEVKMIKSTCYLIGT